jgi:hypothetical protein
MSRALLILLALSIITHVAFAQQLPPPQNPAGDEPAPQRQGPALVPPQNVRQQPPPRAPIGWQAAKKNPEQLRALVAALRQAEKDRKQARIDRMNQFKAARAAEEQKLYQDWHERYLADTPVRVEYYRALAAAAQSQPAISYYTPPYFYGADPPVILPVVYAPVIATPVFRPCSYGSVYSWGW